MAGSFAVRPAKIFEAYNMAKKVGHPHWTLKWQDRYLVIAGLTIKWSRNWGSHAGQKYSCILGTREKLYWTLIFHGRLNLTNIQSYGHFLLFSRDKKEIYRKKSPEIFVRFFAIGCLLGDWDESAYWPTCQPPCMLQSSVCRYRSSLLRAHWTSLVSVFVKTNCKSGTGVYIHKL